jgi:diguanylate cyclase (GGDEF)-like protein
VDADRRAAYLAAYDLFEAVQGEAHAGAAAQAAVALEAAERAGWPEVGFVLAAAGVVHAVTRPVDGVGAEAAASLRRRAEELEAPAFQAMALGLCALTASAVGDTAALLADASRAVALLDDDSQPPLDRSTAYVVVAAAFNTLRLWELVDELYTRAAEVGRQCEAPGQAAALAVNRVLTRLEWALAVLENGDEQESRFRLGRAGEAVPAALETQLPPLWRRNVEACADIVALLEGTGSDCLEDPLERLAGHRAELAAEGDIEVLPLLEAAAALALMRRGRLAEAVAAASRLPPALSCSSGARSFPFWVRATVLAASAPSAATGVQQEHAALVSRLRWESRLAVLAAARAQIAVERRQADHERLTQAVNTDALTGLYNRRSFDAWLERTPDQQRGRTALLLVDLDNFKQINDRHGHQAGDEVLRRVGRLMRASVRAGDMALRHGGDEFAVLLWETQLTAATALERARALRDAIRSEHWSEVVAGLVVTASIGVAVALPEGAEPDAMTSIDAGRLYLAADAALYAAKRDGTGIVLAPTTG